MSVLYVTSDYCHADRLISWDTNVLDGYHSLLTLLGLNRNIRTVEIPHFYFSLVDSWVLFFSMVDCLTTTTYSNPRHSRLKELRETGKKTLANLKKGGRWLLVKQLALELNALRPSVSSQPFSIDSEKRYRRPKRDCSSGNVLHLTLIAWLGNNLNSSTPQSSCLTETNRHCVYVGTGKLRRQFVAIDNL